MARPRRNDFWRVFPHRTFACAALVCYLATAVGFPLPRLSSKDHRQPFPCQDHPCGCQTAEQCWRHCCCFTPEERFAWARTHHIEPPSYAERPAASGWHTARVRDGVVCTHCGDRQACQAYSAPAQRSCCAKQQDVRPCCTKESDRSTKGVKPKAPTRVAWLSGVAALGCQGITSLWLSVGAVLPPPIPQTWRDWLVPVGWVRHHDASPLVLTPTPPDPPPRRACR
jgi:hypothetical protein